MRFPAVVLFCLMMSVVSGTVQAARFNIEDYGATAGDQTDDTAAISKALQACGAAGGGTVHVPAGVWLVSRQGSESPILELPSNTTLSGEGTASILKFDPAVNQTNFWRMLGNGADGCRNVVVRDLHLDGSNTFRSYEPGKTPEHNHGIFLHSEKGVIENITIRDCLIENFSGDGVGLSLGCRHITVRDVALRNFVRQGIQMAGGNGARDYLVTGCQDLAGEVQPGGSTIHVEHARGLKNVIISGNRCRHSILAGGVDGITIQDNVINGRLVGNGNSNFLVQGNVIRGHDAAGFVVQLGFADGLILKDNIVSSSHAEAGGLYVWGTSRYNPAPSRDVLISGNLVRVGGRGILLNGVDGGRVHDNRIRTGDMQQQVVLQRTEDVETDAAAE
ncbi:MAG: right-handed parallel beta-helix repeat-containing protein [Planctomycetaceae bacterium]|nr:right-handed parallel beta-helix repeat-containing protein [Planctomycetaceae bacterium]